MSGPKLGYSTSKIAETCERIPCEAYIDKLRKWQRTLDQPEHVEPDGHGHQWGRVQLDEVKRYAKEWEESTPGSQTVRGVQGVQASDR
jgi:hypothetical protein